MLKIACFAVAISLPATASVDINFSLLQETSHRFSLPQQIIAIGISGATYTSNFQGDTTPPGAATFRINPYNSQIGYSDAILSIGRNDRLPGGGSNGVQIEVLPSRTSFAQSRGSIAMFDISRQLAALETFSYCGDPGLFCFNFWSVVDPRAPLFTSFTQNLLNVFAPTEDIVASNAGTIETAANLSWLDEGTQEVHLLVTPEPSSIFLLAMVFAVFGLRYAPKKARFSPHCPPTP